MATSTIPAPPPSRDTAPCPPPIEPDPLRGLWAYCSACGDRTTLGHDRGSLHLCPGCDLDAETADEDPEGLL